MYSLKNPLGGCLGSEAEEGRGKLRKAGGRCMQPLISRFPNGISCQRHPVREGNAGKGNILVPAGIKNKL